MQNQHPSMNKSLDSYQELRGRLLIQIIEKISKDERFTAAWLTGSLSRNDEDPFSDIDISLVIADEYSEQICQKFEQVSAQTSLERYSLFSQFGKPALIRNYTVNFT